MKTKTFIIKVLMLIAIILFRIIYNSGNKKYDTHPLE